MNIGTYKYTALPHGDSIRLLILQPAVSRDEPIHGSLLVTSLSDCDYDLIEPYTALSYVWGDPGQTGTLILDGSHSVTITATLAAALTDLRDGHRTRRIWADALCIDQSNLPERNHQVSLMGAIYRTAHNTVIHLGSASAEASLILQHTPRSAASIYPPIDSATRDAVHHAAASDLLMRPWFRRVWIFQELLLSRDPWVQCGGLRARWTDLVTFLAPNTAPEPPFRVLEAIQYSGGGGNGGTMVMLLRARRGLGATDARDFVYAHLGLASDVDAVTAEVPVDYALSLGQVFGRTAKYVLRAVGLAALVDMLDAEGSGDEKNGRRNDLPSWAPDWTREGGKRGSMYKDNLQSRMMLKGSLFTFVDDPLMLLVPGYQVDVLSRVGDLLPPEPQQALSEQYQQAVQGVGAIYAAGGGVWYSGDEMGRYAHVSVRGQEAEHEHLCRVMGEEWVRFLRRGPAKSTIQGNGGQENGQFLDDFGAWLNDQASKKRIYVGSAGDGLIRLLHDYAYPGISGSPLEGRRLAQTATGVFGLVPPQAQKGDIVVSLAKDDAAVLLRPVTVPDRQSVDQAVSSKVQADGLYMTVSNEEDSFWTASGGSQEAIEHGTLVGHCYFDGQVGWGLSQKPKAEDVRVYAIH